VRREREDEVGFFFLDDGNAWFWVADKSRSPSSVAMSSSYSGSLGSSALGGYKGSDMAPSAIDCSINGFGLAIWPHRAVISTVVWNRVIGISASAERHRIVRLILALALPQSSWWYTEREE
jgi:hypothetical protein